MTTKRIKIIMQHDANRQLLEDWLQVNYSLADSHTDGFEDVDLVLVDRGGFATHYAILSKQKEEIKPLFLPIVLISRDHIDYQQQAIWNVLDGFIQTPINLHHLKRQLDVLLRTRHLSRQAIEQSQTLTKLYQGIESSSDAIIIIENNRVTHVNRASTEIFGVELSHTNAQSYLQQINSVDQSLLAEFDNIVETPLHKELMLCKHDGSPIPMLVRINHILNREESYIISCTDISQQRDAQAAEHKQHLLSDVLQDTAMTLTSTLDMQEVFERILGNIGRLIPIQTAAICLIENGFAAIACSQGYNSEEIEKLSQFFSQNSLHSLSFFQDLIEDGQVIQITDQSPMRIPRLYSSSALIITPIVLNADTIGFILIELNHSLFSSNLDRNHLKVFAAQAASAIQNARLYAKSQSIAVSEERERLARDFHDSVTQTLFSASMIAESIKRSSHNVSEDISELLEELHLLIRGALAETRTLLLELKPTKLLETDLSDLLRQLVESIWSRKQITLNVDVQQASNVPLRIKVAFYRIAQEAFHNIVKHSKASTVNLYYRNNQETVILLISDNGVGFDMQNPNHGLGLSNMSQRAEKIQATFEIDSAEKQGTKIQLIWNNLDTISGEQHE